MENLIINKDNGENLEVFSEILKKDKSTMINEALELYFEHQQNILAEKGLADENAMTNLDYDEFWGDVDLDD
jgi:phosphoribosyl-ATP pyrophosphohydrolase